MHFSSLGRLKILPVVSSVVASSEVDDGVVDVVSMADNTVTTRQKTRPNNHTSIFYNFYVFMTMGNNKEIEH